MVPQNHQLRQRNSKFHSAPLYFLFRRQPRFISPVQFMYYMYNTHFCISFSASNSFHLQFGRSPVDKRPNWEETLQTLAISARVWKTPSYVTEMKISKLRRPFRIFWSKGERVSKGANIWESAKHDVREIQIYPTFAAENVKAINFTHHNVMQ